MESASNRVAAIYRSGQFARLYALFSLHRQERGCLDNCTTAHASQMRLDPWSGRLTVGEPFPASLDGREAKRS